MASPSRPTSPEIPSPYLSPTFCAATHVISLLSLPPSHLQTTLSTLTNLRDSLSATLRSESSSWDTLTPSISQLHSTLSATQLVTSLQTTLSTLQSSPVLSSTYSTQMSTATSKTALLTRTVSLSSSISHLATLLDSLDSSLQSTQTLAQAYALASSPALLQVSALDSVRSTLESRRVTLQSSLHMTFLDSIFTPNSISSSHSPSDQAVAIDLLSGTGTAANVLADATTTRLVALVKDTVLTTLTTTPTSFASSSFTAISPGKEVTSWSVRSAMSVMTGRRAAHVFRQDVSAVARAEAKEVVEKTRKSMEGVLGRVIMLVGEKKGDIEMTNTVKFVVAEIERVMVGFVGALLGLHAEKGKMEGKNELELERQDSSSNGISLIPRTNSVRRGRGALEKNWEIERGCSMYDAFQMLVKSLPGLPQSMYLLEVIFQPVTEFERHCQNVKKGWEDQGVKEEEKKEECRMQTLDDLMNTAVEVFIRTVSQDVKNYMDDVFGNRAGTLLQPLSSPNDSTMLANGSQYILPPLSQTQLVIDVIGSCLSLGAAIPNIADCMGKLINSHVLTPFSNRAIYALNLAASWTDAGMLMGKMKEYALSQRETYGVVQKQEELRRYTTVSKQEAQEERMKRKKNVDEFSNSNLVNVIRNNPELSVKCLTTLTAKQRHDLCKHPHLLNESEWNAVVRLIANAKIVLNELEHCVNEQQDEVMNMKGTDPTSMRYASTDHNQWTNLREMLQERNMATKEQKVITKTIRTTELACRILREDIMERGVVLLHCEVMLHCFSQVARILSEDLDVTNKITDSTSEDSISDCEDSIREPVLDDENSDEEEKQKEMRMLRGMPWPLSGKGLSGDSDSSAAKNEFDEFGDRIGSTVDLVIETEIDEYNSLIGREENSVEGGIFALNAASPAPPVSKLDRRIVEKGHILGTQLRYRDGCLKANLTVEDHEFVFCRADEAVSLGIRMSGEVRPQGDRDVATGARLLVDAIAKQAAETIGWPLVESDYSVAEGSSQSASECRTLLYAAGMM